MFFNQTARAALLVIFSTAASVTASAQTVAVTGGYIEPGSLALDRKSPAEAIKEGFDNAPWRWGPIRIEPRFSIGNVGYYENLLGPAEDGEELSDVRASVGAGLTGYTRIGTKTFLSAFVTPEYTWWQDLDKLRQLNENYGLGAYGAYNRMQIVARVTSTEREQPLSGELDIPIQLRQERADLEIRLELRPRLFVEGRAASGDVRYGQELSDEFPDASFSRLDRTTEQKSFILALELRSGLEIGLGVVSLDSEFLDDRGGRSSSETGPTLRLRRTATRSTIEASVRVRDVGFENDEIEPFEELTGLTRLTFEIGPRTSTALYGFRDLVYGSSAEDSTIDEYRWGVSLNRALGRRFEGALFFETGELEFRDPAGPNETRIDDLEAWGASVRAEISRKISLTARFSDVSYDSTRPDDSRSTTRLGIGIELASLLPW